ncbi:DUF6979 family protein [Neisseria sp. 23W00296]|uniref:DUF6979 family protein n=1 Tax=unclassified Neisseria TaxID=2623750 RepID=UPI0037564DDA
MKIYGDIAVKAAESYSKYEDMEQAWTEIAASFPIKESIRKKGCPKNAFLGLCRAGLVKGINPEKVKTKHSKNGEYAVAAVSLLKNDPEWANQKKSVFWREIVGNEKNITASFMSF